jgi:predicted phage baseplate assembly protein
MTGPPAALPDRRRLLLSRDATFNGVDFAEARPGDGIDVHFINRVRVKGTLARDRPPVTLTASGGVPAPGVHPIDEDAGWSTDTGGRPVLRVRVALPDAAARYRLTVHSDRVDPYLSTAAITVRTRGDAVGCAAGEAAGEPPGGPAVAVDYLAKDFTSFLLALSNFSAARYPLWAERSEADFGVMLMEALSALADELSYLQDRVAAEATIGTATQRLSLARHVRLVDYEPMPALAARTVLQFDVAPGSGPALPDVIQVQASGGQAGTADFAAGPLFGGPVFGGPVFGGPVSGSRGFASPRPALDTRWNRYDQSGRVPQLVPYRWDPSVTWLRRGATSMWVDGHGHGFYQGQHLLIDTSAATEGDSPVREFVQVTAAEERTDPVQDRAVTLIRWSDGLTSDHDLTRTELAGNLLPAVHGQVTDESFAVPGEEKPPALPLAIVRVDHSDSPAHCLYTLAGPLAWQAVPGADGGRAHPRPLLTLRELAPAVPAPAVPAPAVPAPAVPASTVPASTVLASTAPASGGPVEVAAATGNGTGNGNGTGTGTGNGTRATWQWVPRLIDANATTRAFTVTPERYSPAAPADGPSFFDYDGDGVTVRFGDGVFGRPPAPGTTFRARYLAGGGEAGNVAADTIVAVAPGDPANGLVWRCTNPFAATGGADAETHAQIRARAPQQARSGVLSLAGPADYEAAARLFSKAGPAFSPVDTAFPPAGAGNLAWARQAIAAARWTGSWLSIATIADPLTAEPPAAQLAALADLAEVLGARRLAGTDISVALARYRWLDLRVTCVTRLGHQPGDVVAAVLSQLAPHTGANGATGFFGRDKWAFGQPLEASALMAAIQSCPGVAGITRADYRRAHSPGKWYPLRPTLGIAPGEILRIDNDPNQPGRGLLFVTAEATR